MKKLNMFFRKFNSAIKNNLFVLHIVWKISKFRFFIKTITTFFSALLPVVNILIIRYVIVALERNSVDYKTSWGDIFRILIIFAGIQILIKSFDVWIASYFDPILVANINKKMDFRFLDKIKEFDYWCFEDPEFYDKFVRAIKQVDIITHRVFASFFGLCSSIISIILIISLISSMDGFVVFFAVFSVLVNFLTSLFTSKLSFTASQTTTPFSRQQNYLKRLMLFPEYVKDFQLYNIIPTGKKYYTVAHEKAKNILKMAGKNIAITNCIGAVLSIFCMAGQLIFLISRVLQGIYTIADFSALSTASSQLETTLNSFFTCIANFYQNSLEIDNLRFVYDYKSSHDYHVFELPCDHEAGIHIEARHLGFSYPNTNDFAINDISFSILPGEKISIVGLNGSGKTTLVKLLLGLYKPTSGDILINGKSISLYSQGELRKIMGVSFQDNHIFAYSLRENISFTDDITKNGYKSLDLLGMECLISSLPNGFDTILSREFDSSGVNISGGEAQKVCIARALNANASVYIFDEPSSALDPISEHEINSVIFGLTNSTVILISHRLSTTIMSDRIFYLDNGRLIEQGSHSELLQKNGAYAKLFYLQASQYNS